MILIFCLFILSSCNKDGSQWGDISDTQDIPPVNVVQHIDIGEDETLIDHIQFEDSKLRISWTIQIDESNVINLSWTVWKEWFWTNTFRVELRDMNDTTIAIGPIITHDDVWSLDRVAYQWLLPYLSPSSFSWYIVFIADQSRWETSEVLFKKIEVRFQK